MKHRIFARVLSGRAAFSIVELLIVIAIIGLLIQLALPAIQMSQESARRLKCSQQLHQIGVAWMGHLTAQKHYPTGGWNGAWTGDPDRGYGGKQPGGWGYNILPYIEQGALHDLGKGEEKKAKADKAYQVLKTPIPMFYCPSRRLVRAYIMPYPKTVCFNASLEPLRRGVLRLGGRTDYAACLGDVANSRFLEPASPKTLEEGDSGFAWPEEKRYTGVSFCRSNISDKDVKDGTSKTYIVGEKWVPWSAYISGYDLGDNEFYTVGMQADTYRTTAKNSPPHPDAEVADARVAKYGFGSAHPGVWMALFADGSVKAMGFDIDPEQHRRNGTRAEGK
jgi:type II secretory pathway pseudopilin PulG